MGDVGADPASDEVEVVEAVLLQASIAATFKLVETLFKDATASLSFKASAYWYIVVALGRTLAPGTVGSSFATARSILRGVGRSPSFSVPASPSLSSLSSSTSSIAVRLVIPFIIRSRKLVPRA